MIAAENVKLSKEDFEPIKNELQKLQSKINQKKSMTFNENEVLQIIQLDIKIPENFNLVVAFVFGYNLALRPIENFDLLIENVFVEIDKNAKCKTCNSYLKINFKRKKNRKINNSKSRIILSSESFCCVCAIIKYLSLLKTKKGKLHKIIELNENKEFNATKDMKSKWFYKFPEIIARKLKLKNPGDYTGKALRSTTATLAAKHHFSSSIIDYLGGWSSKSGISNEYILKNDDYDLKISNDFNNIIENQKIENNKIINNNNNNVIVNNNLKVINNNNISQEVTKKLSQEIVEKITEENEKKRKKSELDSKNGIDIEIEINVKDDKLIYENAPEIIKKLKADENCKNSKIKLKIQQI